MTSMVNNNIRCKTLTYTNAKRSIVAIKIDCTKEQQCNQTVRGKLLYLCSKYNSSRGKLNSLNTEDRRKLVFTTVAMLYSRNKHFPAKL